MNFQGMQIKGVKTRKFRARLARNAVVIFLSVAFALNASTALAQLAGTWQHPLAIWSVDGYKFGEYVSYLKKYHLADDAFATAGTPVMATANGTVKALYNFSSYQNYGGLILIEHQNVDGSLVVSLYGHLDPYKFVVSVGQEVQRGQLIGYIGDPSVNGGWPEHIHYGIRNGGYVATPWVYWGYGDSTMLAQWSDPTAYIASHNDVIEVERVPTASRDRYETAVGVSQRRFPNAGAAKTVLLASGATHADALAAAPLVKSDTALLLTKSNELPTTTENEVKRLLPAGGSVIVLGGEKTIGTPVTDRLAALGFAVTKIAGANREATATQIAEKMGNLSVTFLVNKSAFADAVSVSGAAANTGTPVLLTNANTLSAATRDFLTQRTGLTKVVLVGGATALSAALEQEVKTIPHITQVVRLSGADRYATNVAVNTAYTTNPKNLVVATGLDYPDALTGGGLAGNSQGALLLTKNTAIPGPTQSYAFSLRNNIDRAFVLGGNTAIDLDLDLSLATLLNAPFTTASAPDPGASSGGDGASAPSFVLTQATGKNIQDILVPVPANFESKSEVFRQADIIRVKDPQAQGEIVDAVVISRVSKNLEQTFAEQMRDWFGTDVVKTASGSHGLRLLAPLPGFEPTVTAVLERTDDYLIFEARLPESVALETFQFLAEKNAQ